MKIQNDLKEIFDSNASHGKRVLVGNDQYKTINLMTFEDLKKALPKILALGKPEPLAKNKKWIQVCDHKWEKVPKTLSLHCKLCGRYDHG